MNYISILMTIIVYWFILGFLLGYVYQDSLIVSAQIEGNTSYGIGTDTSLINMSVGEPTETTSLKSFVNALKTMFAFRTPIASGVPNGIAVIISFINWFLVIILGISIYRIANPISGG